MERYQLAQLNIARLIAPLDDPRIAGFASQLAHVNQLAESSPGFVWRLRGDGPFHDDPLVLVNMSVWESMEALANFTYKAREHVAVFRDRSLWFEKMDQAHACLWWVPYGHVPAVEEGFERLERFRTHGPSAHAFWFSQPFSSPDMRSTAE